MILGLHRLAGLRKDLVGSDSDPDYAIVLKKALQWILLSPQDSLHYMVMLFETKTSSAMSKQLTKCRGAAAVECLAANLLGTAGGVACLAHGLTPMKEGAECYCTPVAWGLPGTTRIAQARTCLH